MDPENEDFEVDRAILNHIKSDTNEPDITESRAINFLVFNPKGEILSFSNGFLDLLGFSSKEVEGKNVSSIFFNPSDSKKFSNNYDEDEFSSGAIELKHKSGARVYTIFYNNYNSEMHMNLMFFIAA